MHHLDGMQDCLASVASCLSVLRAVRIDYRDHVSEVVIGVSRISYLDTEFVSVALTVEYADYLAHFREFPVATELLNAILVQHRSPRFCGLPCCSGSALQRIRLAQRNLSSAAFGPRHFPIFELSLNESVGFVRCFKFHLLPTQAFSEHTGILEHQAVCP